MNTSIASYKCKVGKENADNYFNHGVRTADDHLDSGGFIYKLSGGMLIRTRTTQGVPHGFLSAKRSSITGFSASSGQRMRRYLRSCSTQYTWMVTLTYPFSYPSNGHAVKEHLRRFCQELQREYYRHRKAGGMEDFSAFWFLEFQQRGAPHFHIFTNFVAYKGIDTKKWISELWYRIVDSEDLRHKQAGTRFEKLYSGRAGTISYATKYAAKAEQKAVPEGYENVGRFWGVYGCRMVVSAATWVSDREHKDTRVSKVVKQMKELLESAEKEQKTRVLVYKKAESSVILIKDEEVMIRIEVLISRLMCLTMRHEQYFDLAEVEP